MTPEGGARGYPYNFIKITHPTQSRKDWPHHRGLRPLLFYNNGVGFSTSHKNQIIESAVKMGPTVFHPYPIRLESLTVCGCHYKGSILKTLSVGLACEP